MTASASMPTPFDAPTGLGERLTFPTARLAYRMGFVDGGDGPLKQLSHQLGLGDSAQAEAALTLGARFLAHGFDADEINAMILHHYQEAARREAARGIPGLSSEDCLG